MKRLKAGGVDVEDDTPFWAQNPDLIKMTILVGILSERFTVFDLIALERTNRSMANVLRNVDSRSVWFQFFMALADKYGLYRSQDDGTILRPALDNFQTSYFNKLPVPINWRKMTIAIVSSVNAG